MSSSPDVLAGPAGQHTELLDGRSARVTPVQPRELRSCSWTRLGGSAVLDETGEGVLGDRVAENGAVA